MPGDPFYRSPGWRKLRTAALARDGATCVVPGCGQRAAVVDHIVSRRKGGADALSNLRSLCRDHDNQVKERGARRKSGGKLTVRGATPDGAPRDPGHWWYR